MKIFHCKLLLDIYFSILSKYLKSLFISFSLLPGKKAIYLLESWFIFFFNMKNRMTYK